MTCSMMCRIEWFSDHDCHWPFFGPHGHDEYAGHGSECEQQFPAHVARVLSTENLAEL